MGKARSDKYKVFQKAAARYGAQRTCGSGIQSHNVFLLLFLPPSVREIHSRNVRLIFGNRYSASLLIPLLFLQAESDARRF